MQSPPLNVVIATVGTDGDVFPYAALGRSLRRRGHGVTLVTIERYRGLAGRLGLGFAPLYTNAEADAGLRNPDFWHPLKGPKVAADWFGPFIPRDYAILRDLAGRPGSVLVANPGVLAARILRETHGVPLATVALQPWLIHGNLAPPLLIGLPLPTPAPRLVGDLVWRLTDVAVDLLIGRHLNGFRQTLGLRRVHRMFRWWFSPDLLLGMFPAWYAPPQADWPPQVRLAGFPMFDGDAGGRDAGGGEDAGGGGGLPADVEAFLAAGDPPIAFTAGTGMTRPAAFFRAAADACRRLNRRGLLLTGFPEHLPADLPAGARAVRYAPFGALFPRCAAVVHHGGIGTTARALAAGVPQLVVPVAFDQPDNGRRLVRLGVGDVLPPRPPDGPTVARRLAALLTPDRVAAAARYRDRFGGPDGCEVGAERVEAMAAGGGSPAAPPRGGGDRADRFGTLPLTG